MNVSVLEAEDKDLDKLFVLANMFWSESNYAKVGLTLEPSAWYKTVRDCLSWPSTACLMAVVNGEPVGYVMVYYQTDFTVERIGEMFQFYVHPDYRGTKVARSLVDAAVKKYESWGCKRCYADCSPGISSYSHLSQFKNLWAKYGYSQVGITLMKEF